MKGYVLITLTVCLQMLFSVQSIFAADMSAGNGLEFFSKKTHKKPTKSKTTTRKAKNINIIEYLSTSFDQKNNSVKVPFIGHNIVLIYSAFDSRIEASQKGEFETTESHIKRLINETSLPLYGEVKSDSTLAFVIKPESKYDADSQVLSIIFKPKPAITYEFDKDYSKIVIDVAETRNYTGKSIGQNAYGAEIETTSRRLEKYQIAIHNFNSFGFKKIYSKTDLELIKGFGKAPDNILEKVRNMYGEIIFEHKMIIPLDKAKILKDNIEAIAITKIVKPNISKGTYYSEATYSSPTTRVEKYYYVDVDLESLWFYDKSTGIILEKLYNNN